MIGEDVGMRALPVEAFLREVLGSFFLNGFSVGGALLPFVGPGSGSRGHGRQCARRYCIFQGGSLKVRWSGEDWGVSSQFARGVTSYELEIWGRGNPYRLSEDAVKSHRTASSEIS